MLKTGRFLDLQNQRPGPVSSFLSKKTQNDVGKIMEYQSGWWFQPTPSEKYEFVSWNDDIPNIWKVIKFMFQTTNQSMKNFPASHV
jgi:hypothetical protein